MQPIKMVMTGGWFLFFVLSTLTLNGAWGVFHTATPSEDSCISHWEMSKETTNLIPLILYGPKSTWLVVSTPLKNISQLG